MDANGYDYVVGIGTGGVVPASLIAFQLALPLHILWYSYRDSLNRPVHSKPRLGGAPDDLPDDGHVLLVDDVSVSGKTLEEAKNYLGDRFITTLVLTGSADIVLFPALTDCVVWPWKPQVKT